MKSLRPSMRERKRYLLIKAKNPVENIEKSLFEFLGVLGVSKTGVNFIKSNNSSAIISVNREMLNEVRAGFCVFKERIIVERVSGTLRGLNNHTNKFKKSS